VCAAAFLLVFCSPRKPARVLVLGFDGLDPRIVDLLMSEGRLQNFARIRRDGAYGRLISARPLLSPVVWTTIATGKNPDQHGIGHFVAVDPSSGESVPVTSRNRMVKAVWDVASDEGKKVGVVGWWATWPAPLVNGFVVSDHTCYHFLFPQGTNPPAAAEGLTHPPGLLSRIEPLIRKPADVGPVDVAPFVDVEPDELARPFAFEDEVSHLRWALASSDTYRRLGLELWRSERPDLMLTYIEGTDSIAHLFGHLFRAADLEGELARQQARYGHAVEQMYVWADKALGDYLAAMDDTTTLVVMSDHGFDLGAAQDDPSKTRDMRRVSEQFHRLEGVLYLFGAGVRRGRIDRPGILDVTPTVLALLGLPKAEDMPGRVLQDMIVVDPPKRRVTSYEKNALVAGETPHDPKVDPQILERLQSLGYVGEGGRPRSPQGERNLAALAFQAGRYEEATAAYERLLKEEPRDPALHASLAGCLGAMSRYDDAGRHLDIAIQLAPLNVEAYHNRGVIYERQHRRDAAIAQYRLAVRYDPKYEPSRQALLRLVGSADVREPRSEAEQQAAASAATAATAAPPG